MKNKMGLLFKGIRENKNISIRKASDGVVSKSQLSRFERGENDISALKLFNLLDNIEMSLEEFVEMFREFDIDENRKKFNSIGKLEQAGDFDGLKKFYYNEMDLFYNSLKTYHRFNALSIKSVLFEHGIGEGLDYNEKKSITDYLYEIIQWSQYELQLFTLNLSQIDYPIVKKIIREIIQREEFYINIPENFSLVLMIIRNVSVVAVRNKDFETTNLLLNWLENSQDNENDFRIKMVKKTILVEYYEKIGHVNAAISELSDIVFYYEKFGNKYYYDLHLKELNELKKLTNQRR